MRKLVGLILVLALLGAGIYFFRSWLFPPYAEKLFPQETLVYFYLPNARQAGKVISQTRLWEQLDHSSRLNPKLQFSRLFVLIENSTGVDIRPLLAQITRDAAMGIFGLPAGKRGGALSVYVEDEKETRRLIEQQIDPAFRRRVPDLKKQEATHADITYYKYSSERFPPSVSPCYFVKKHHLVIAVSQQSMETVLDAQAGKIPRLKDSPVFKQAKDAVDSADGLFAFVNVQKALGLLGEGLPSSASRIFPDVIRLTGINALETFSYKATVTDGGFSESAVVSLAPQPEGLLKIYLQQRPARMEALQSIPGSVTLLTAGTLADFAALWDQIHARIGSLLNRGQSDRWKEIEDFINGILNFDIRKDLLETLGDQFAVAYETAGGAADLQKTRVLLALKLQKPELFAETMDRIAGLAVAAGGFKRGQDGSYKGKKIRLLNSTSGNEFTPAYYVNGSWFTFSSQTDFLKRSIDTDSKSCILADPDYRHVTSTFPSEVNGLTYTRVSSYLQNLIATLNPEDPTIKQEAQKIAGQLFGSATYVVFEKDRIYFRSFSSMPLAFLILPGLVAAYSR